MAEEINKPGDSVRIVLFDKAASDKFLILREVDDSEFKLPGGKLDGEETPIEAALRELGEELGDIDVSSVKYVGELKNDDGISTRHIFAGTIGVEDIRPTQEVLSVEPTTLESIPEGRNQSHIRTAAELALKSLSEIT